ncbi:hypothetical protein Y1Q_0008866 [Alligator mississippiensis]|nr:hypothetical protein Y1Q_0008866 [Alligator mississippiensis]
MDSAEQVFDIWWHWQCGGDARAPPERGSAPPVKRHHQHCQQLLLATPHRQHCWQHRRAVHHHCWLPAVSAELDMVSD